MPHMRSMPENQRPPAGPPAPLLDAANSCGNMVFPSKDGPRPCIFSFSSQPRHAITFRRPSHRTVEPHKVFMPAIESIASQAAAAGRPPPVLQHPQADTLEPGRPACGRTRRLDRRVMASITRKTGTTCASSSPRESACSISAAARAGCSTRSSLAKASASTSAGTMIERARRRASAPDLRPRRHREPRRPAGSRRAVRRHRHVRHASARSTTAWRRCGALHRLLRAAHADHRQSISAGSGSRCSPLFAASDRPRRHGRRTGCRARTSPTCSISRTSTSSSASGGCCRRSGCSASAG